MMGGMLAGHDQSGGEIQVKENGRKVKLFYGMSSATAMEKHSGGVAEYRYTSLAHWVSVDQEYFIVELVRVKQLRFHTEVM